MPASSVKISVEEKTKQQLADLKRRYNEAGQEIKQLNNPHARIAVFLDGWVQRNFKTEGGKVGGWKPFKNGGRVSANETKGSESFQSYVGFKSGGGFVADGFLDRSAKLLQDTGRLKLSVIPFSSKANAGIGSDLPYSKPHNEGKGVPKRRILPVFGEVKSDVERIYAGFVNEVVDKNSLGDGKVK